MNDAQFGELVNELDKLRRAHPDLVPECQIQVAFNGERLQAVSAMMFATLLSHIFHAHTHDKDQS